MPAGSLIRGDGKGVNIPVNLTQAVLLLPALVLSVIVVPAACLLEFQGIGSLAAPVPAGSTSNFYWTFLQYAPILMTLAFTSSMVTTANVARTVWRDDAAEQEEEAAQMVDPEHAELPASNSPAGAAPASAEDGGVAGACAPPPLQQPSRPTVLRKPGWGGLMSVMHLPVGVVSKSRARRKAESDSQKVALAKALLQRPSAFEIAQWLLMLLYIVVMLVAGSVAEPRNPLWVAGARGFLIGFGVLTMLGVLIAGVTVRNARLTLLVRSEAQTPRRVTEFLRRACACLLLQHFTFFFNGVQAANIAPAVQPLAFTPSLEVAMSTAPCLLVTTAYLSANCTRALDFYELTPGVTLTCDDGGWNHYASAYSACGGALSVSTRRLKPCGLKPCGLKPCGLAAL